MYFLAKTIINPLTHKLINVSLRKHLSYFSILLLIITLSNACVVNKKVQYLQKDDTGKLTNTELRSQLADYDMQMHAIGLTHMRCFEERQAGVRSPAPLVMKYLGTEAEKTKSELLLKIMGSRGLGWEGDSFTDEELDTLRLWAMSKAMTIAGGSSEIQLNVIAKSVLELPQE